MAISIVGAGIFAILFLLTLGLISNVSSTSLQNMQNQIFLTSCPMPLQNQQINQTSITIVNNHVQFDAFAPNTNINNVTGTGTFFDCFLAPSPPTFTNPIPTVSTISPNYGATGFANYPSGFVLYIGDTFAVFFAKLQAMLTLIFNFISPTGFNIAGFTITSLSAFGQLVVIGIYGMCYVVIGIMIYKTVSPFSGVS